MNTLHRALVATAVMAAMSVALAPQTLAAESARGATETAQVAAATSDAETAAGYLKQWMFDPNHPGHLLYTKSSFSGPASRNTNLKNKLEHRFLQWESQTWGINLGWTDDASPATATRVSRWFFTMGDEARPVRYGDLVAIGNGGSPSYIRYASRTFGINLDWSKTPRYEWKLLGGKVGEPVRSGQWLAIYNTVTKQPLIYFDRSVGGDIGWPDSETWGEQITDAAMAFIKEHWDEGLAFLLLA
ncbi:hypothetical protein [Cellulomonas sp. URHD0024]|uniref:hypothetical protein n=1 Tax=Cellulomonas sp. URHD0024 TaxID=1302620 RepID=UPI000403D467|nr:hypothetical protein [Cellulomonas sp. URHD0024]